MPTHVLNLPAGASALWQNRLGLLLESTGEGVFGIDLAGNYVFINCAGAQMLGFAAEEVMGRNMHALTHHGHPDDSPYADSDCPIFNAFRQGLPCRVDTEVFWRNGCGGGAGALFARMMRSRFRPSSSWASQSVGGARRVCGRFCARLDYSRPHSLF